MEHALPDDWEPLLLEVDGKPAGFAVNLNASTPARMQARPHMCAIAIPLHSPDSNGLSGEEENSELLRFQDAIANPLARQHDAQFVARVTTDGERTLYFYLGNPEGLEDSLDRLLADFRHYDWRHEVVEEPEWETYWEFLHPSPEELQIIMNLRVLRTMQEHGDTLTQIRRVDHWLYFPSEAELTQFKNHELMAHFQIESEGEENGALRLHIFRNESVAPNDIHRSTIELLRAAQECGGNYDGWEAEGE